LIGLVLAAAFLVREVARSPRLIRVHFPEIATLSPGDPVVQGGVQVGAIESIRLDSSGAGTDALVTLELFHHRPLARDARFLNFSHSLMGARKVWILAGASPHPLDESKVQKGLFAPGLAETLHKVDSLVVVIARLRDQTERLLTEDNPLRSPVAAARLLDTAAHRLNHLTGRLASARAALLTSLQGLNSAAEQTRRGVRAAEPPARTALLRARDLVDALESVQENLDTLLTRLEKITALAGDSTAAGRLLYEDAAYAKLEKSVRLLEKTARLMEKDGLADSIKIRPKLR
jgi:ABC-type transporter Mla subunit MlaD